MPCPAVPFGIPEDARELRLNTGKQIFNCGDCLKVFLSNVSLECTKLTYACKTPLELQNLVSCGEACIFSVDGNWKDNANTLWKGKNGVTSADPTGQVLTCLDDCGSMYIYSEMNLNVRVYANVATFQNANDFVSCLNNGALILDELGNQPHGVVWSGDFVLTGMDVGLNRNDWQSISLSGMRIFLDDDNDTSRDRSGRASWNSRNASGEVRETYTIYDDMCDETDIGVIFTNLRQRCS